MDYLKLSPIHQSKTYFINIIISLLISSVTILYAEKTRKMKKLLMLAIYTLLCSEIILSYINYNSKFLFFGILFFFISFHLMEGLLPSILIKEITISTYKGTITGMFSTSQFLGTTFGGILGGYLLNIYNNIQIIFFLEIILTIIWIKIMSSFKEPPYTQ